MSPAILHFLTVLAILAVSGCSKADPVNAEFRIVARVNGSPISDQQVLRYIGRDADELTPEQLKQAQINAIEHLIDEELLVQGAVTSHCDTLPEVQHKIEDLSRRILALSYLDKTAPGPVQHSQEQIRQFFDENPVLFKQRRIYQIREISVTVAAELRESLRARIAAARSLSDIVEWLDARNISFKETAAAWPAEEIPMEVLLPLAEMRNGEMTLFSAPKLMVILQLINSRDAAMSESQATPHINAILTGHLRIEHVADEVKRLRRAATIEYPEKAQTTVHRTALFSF